MKPSKSLMLAAVLLSATLSACGAGTPTVAEDATLSQQIVYGSVSAPGSRPYQVAVLPSSQTNTAYCGGTLIARDWVMTAAHCVYGARASSRVVRAGVYTLSNSSEGQQVRVAQIIVHPNYRDVDPPSFDIALLKLSSAVTTPDAAPAAIPGDAAEAALDVNGKSAVVSGWGLTESGNVSNRLREVSLPITPTGSDCGSRPGNTICGKSVSPGKDSCNGDSGGPLAQRYAGQFYVLGIVSFGPSACRGRGVYTRVNAYADWIAQNSGVTPDGGALSSAALAGGK